MKVQTGMRLDSTLWQNYKTLCETSNVRPCEPVEAYLKACIERQDVQTVLNALQCQSASQKMAHELKLKTELMKLKSDFDIDCKFGEARNHSNIQQYISNITEILPTISDQQLLLETQSSVEKVLEYYGPKLVDEEERYRQREKQLEQEINDQQ